MDRSLLFSLALASALAAPLPALAQPPGPPMHGWFPAHGRIGLEVQPMTPELREHFGAPKDRGVLVERVEAERPAAKAGVRVGDIVLSVDEKPVEAPHDLVRAVHRAPDGAALRLEILRGREKQSIVVQPEPRDEWAKETDQWMERFERGFEEGGRHLERRLDDLERRFEELQKRFEERLRELEERPVGT